MISYKQQEPIPDIDQYDLSFTFGDLWSLFISLFDWRNLTTDRLQAIIESDQFKAQVIVMVCTTALIAYMILVNTV
jgi:hypothetical protein